MLNYARLLIASVQLCHAKSPPYVPSNSVARCLNNSAIFAAGPSELANILGWLTGGRFRSNQRSPVVGFNRLAAQRSLACHTFRNLADRHHLCIGDYRKKASCRESLYARMPFEASCAGESAWGGAAFNLTYHWKSFQYSSRDEVLLAAARAAANRGSRVIVILASGLQQFAKFPEHRESILHKGGHLPAIHRSLALSLLTTTSISIHHPRHTPRRCYYETPPSHNPHLCTQQPRHGLCRPAPSSHVVLTPTTASHVVLAPLRAFSG